MAFNILITAILLGIAPFAAQAEFRDPTKPDYPLPTAITGTTANKPINETELTLSGIWISTKSRRATINGISAKVGQSLLDGSVKVLKIARNTVIVKQNGTIKHLQLLQRPYKKR